MKRLIEQVQQLIQDEGERAAREHGSVHNSSHESYAVLREEVDEARAECINTELFTDKYWDAVKRDDTDQQRLFLEGVQQKAMLAACEFIQTAAMALKALKTINGGK